MNVEPTYSIWKTKPKIPPKQTWAGQALVHEMDARCASNAEFVALNSAQPAAPAID
jgi:hypothetical protein